MSTIAPTPHYNKGDEDMEVLVKEDASYRLVLIRCHFVDLTAGGSASQGRNDLVVSLDSEEGKEYDVTLYTYKNRGIGYDVNVVLDQNEAGTPSGWSFSAGDKIRVAWINPGGVMWGLCLGLAKV